MYVLQKVLQIHIFPSRNSLPEAIILVAYDESSKSDHSLSGNYEKEQILSF
jgi:hypothetical protein